MRKEMTTQEKNVERMERNARMWAKKIERVAEWKANGSKVQKMFGGK